MPDVTPNFAVSFYVAHCVQETTLWLRKSACVCAAAESTAAVPRYGLLAQFVLQKWRGSDGECGDGSVVFYMSFF